MSETWGGPPTYFYHRLGLPSAVLQVATQPPVGCTYVLNVVSARPQLGPCRPACSAGQSPIVSGIVNGIVNGMTVAAHDSH